MIHLNNEIRELGIDELDAVIGAGPAVVGPNEEIAHYFSIHERTTVVNSFEWMHHSKGKK